jgi:hypothetical protein
MNTKWRLENYYLMRIMLGAWFDNGGKRNMSSMGG